jgi:hypothetical protein
MSKPDMVRDGPVRCGEIDNVDVLGRAGAAKIDGERNGLTKKAPRRDWTCAGLSKKEFAL